MKYWWTVPIYLLDLIQDFWLKNASAFQTYVCSFHGRWFWQHLRKKLQLGWPSVEYGRIVWNDLTPRDHSICCPASFQLIFPVQLRFPVQSYQVFHLCLWICLLLQNLYHIGLILLIIRELEITLSVILMALG